MSGEQNNARVQYGPDNPWLNLFNVIPLYEGEAPKERHLIENFMVHESSIALVADGGVGKTFVAIELALRAACGPILNGKPNLFKNFPVKERCCVVMLTVEDNTGDIHRRICAIDPDESLRKSLGGECVILPVKDYIYEGLVLVEKDHEGNNAPSRGWKKIVDHIRDFRENERNKDLPLLVIIDTYSATHHTEENSATGTNEWFRAAGLLRNLGATLVVTHHIRKTDPKAEIKTPSDMKAAVRGSTAFINAMRTVYGIWEMPNAKAILEELGKDERTRVYNMGILKNNTGINWDDRSDPRYPEPMITLRRTESGNLVYDDEIHSMRISLSSNKEKLLEKQREVLRAAILFSVRWYAQHQWPLSKSNLTRDKELFLPETVNHLGYKNEIEPMVQRLISEGWLKQIKIKKTNGHVLDVVNGPYSSGLEAERISVTPSLSWEDYEYDEENQDFVAAS